MTDNEIIKALECCSKMSLYHIPCENCPAIHENCLSGRILIKQALDLINRQKAEIERLKDYPKCVYEYDGDITDYCLKTPCPNYKTVDAIRTEAVKEFAERLKEELEGEYIKVTNKLENAQNIVVSTNIKIVDNLVKEMVGESE